MRRGASSSLSPRPIGHLAINLWDAKAASARDDERVELRRTSERGIGRKDQARLGPEWTFREANDHDFITPLELSIVCVAKGGGERFRRAGQVERVGLFVTDESNPERCHGSTLAEIRGWQNDEDTTNRAKRKIRNPKLAIRNNGQISNEGNDREGRRAFRHSAFRVFEFVSDFVLRNSNFDVTCFYR